MTGLDFRAERVRMGLNQESLGLLLGASRAVISRLENKRKVPRVYELALMQLVSGRRSSLDVAA